MPRARPSVSYPPTPAPSTDITGKKSSANVAQFDSSFELPPAAMGSNSCVSSTSPSVSHASDSSYRPPSPASPIATSHGSSNGSRKRSIAVSQSKVASDDYTLPPPPMRPRKIIQMDPHQKAQQTAAKKTLAPAPASTTAVSKSGPATATSTAAGTKRKQAGTTTAQGRKMARKTAHSLIERRRRSKMNEEFGVLKDMIPGCNGQEMHKLAILQASIEYMRYLEQCVSDLKAAHRVRRDTVNSFTSVQHNNPPPVYTGPTGEEEDEDEDQNQEDGEDDRDDDMQDAGVSPTHTNPSPAIYPSDRMMHSTTTSPNIFALDTRPPSSNTSPKRTHNPTIPSSIHSNTTSPTIHPSPAFSGFQTPSLTQHTNQYPFPVSGPSRKSSLVSLTSPALGPQTTSDHEATEALLMLNSDRRSWSEMGSGKRGMSVRDLLSA